jgi:hypothetical protein
MMVAWYTATVGDINYMTKLGSTGCGSANWSATSQFTFGTGGGQQYQTVRIARDTRSSSNLIALSVMSLDGDIIGILWSGSAWTNDNLLSTTQAAGPPSLTFEASSGDLMLVWSDFANHVYATCTGGTSSCTWATQTTIAFSTGNYGQSDKALCANPSNNELVFAGINTASQLDVAYWSGSAWTATDAVDGTTQADTNGVPLVVCGFLSSGGTTRSIVVYPDSGATNVGFVAGNTSTFTVQSDFAPTPSFAAVQYFRLDVDPKNLDRLMLIVMDTASDLFAKRLVMDSTPTYTWTNADGGSALETTTHTQLRHKLKSQKERESPKRT